MIVKTGWIKDIPDKRDYSITHLTGAVITTPPPVVSEAAFDNRKWCGAIQDQVTSDCVANACASMFEYLQRKQFNRYIDVSRLFIYYLARAEDEVNGDIGSTFRASIKTLVTVGVCEERFWPYTIENINKEPSTTALAFAKTFKGANYYRLDSEGIPPSYVLGWIKYAVSLGLPIVLGFTCYSSATEAIKGRIPFPAPGEILVGGHGIMVCGFNDNETITNPNDGNTVKGALLIQNSWGYRWGNGFGYLPYEFILQGMVADVWAILNVEWLGQDI